MGHSAAERLATLNQAYKEMERIYRWYAREHGLSDAQLWLLYSLREEGCNTQREISAMWHYAPQTVNSALKGLERKGWIRLEQLPGNRRNKRVKLTPEGEGMAQRVIAPLVRAECRAIRELGEEETDTLAALTQGYLGLLHRALEERGTRGARG